MIKAMAGICFLFLAMNPACAQVAGSATHPSFFLDRTRGYGQCEILIISNDSGILNAAVYNTTGLNECPPDQFDPIGLKQLKRRPVLIWSGKTPGAFG